MSRLDAGEIAIVALSSALIYSLGACIVGGVFSEWSVLKRVSADARRTAITLAVLLWPALALYGALLLLTWTRFLPRLSLQGARCIGRGTRDIYRIFRPAKVVVPRMTALKGGKK